MVEYAVVVLSWNTAAAVETGATFRLCDGITVYVNNPRGEPFRLELDVRDINIYESGPREVLVKVYDPDGKALVREVIPDDGVTRKALLPRGSGWYELLCYTRGLEPMMSWSSFSDPAYLESIHKRTFRWDIPGSKKGVYRLMAVGNQDHFVTLKLEPELAYGVSGQPLWLHGRGKMFTKSYVYVPRGTRGLHLGFREPNAPPRRRLTLTAPDGNRLFDSSMPGSDRQGSYEETRFDPPGRYDDQLLVLEITGGDEDFMLHLLLNNEGLSMGSHNLRRGAAAVLSADEATAKAVQGGAIYHDGQVFWHGYQVRFHDWLKTLQPLDFAVNDDRGNEVKVVTVTGGAAGEQGPRLDGLAKREGYYPLNGAHVAPPLCDRIMHDYPAHKNRQALNLAIRDLEKGLRDIATGDHRAVPGWNGNLAYIFAPFEWHYWRPAWRILQQSEAPEQVKEIIREAFILCGDRLAFARGMERVNGNAFSLIVEGLRYCHEATGDPLQKQLFETYFERFVNEGWGAGTGISKSGDCQEHFAHEHHYGTYIARDTWVAVVRDFGDERFRKVLERVRELYTYTWCPQADANPWSSRTAHSFNEGACLWISSAVPKIPEGSTPVLGALWKGDPGPDFTVSVNGGGEWFAARRKNYYLVTFHGRLAPMTINAYFASRCGYGGGLLCQLTVPGKGTVLASTLNDSYGEGMEPHRWRNFHLHSVVGQLADGRPLVTADSEHEGTARLEGNVVSSSGEVRDGSVRVTRKYSFADDHIGCEVKLDPSAYEGQYYQGRRRSDVAEAYEMIPFLPGSRESPTQVKLIRPDGILEELTPEPQLAKTLVIDRGGWGAEVELEKPANVHCGTNHTVLIQLTTKPAPAGNLRLAYRLVPFRRF